MCPMKILNAQADLNLCWEHMSKGTFSHVVTHFSFSVIDLFLVLQIRLPTGKNYAGHIPLLF